MKRVFFYGLFMDHTLLKAKGLNPSTPSMAQVTGYGLRIGERATLVAANNESAYGMVIQLSDKELDGLYADPSVQDYQPTKVTATDDNGHHFPVVSYLLPTEKLIGQNKEYAQQLVQVATQVGLPQAYIDLIKKWTI